jgi:hypothetical protein
VSSNQLNIFETATTIASAIATLAVVVFVVGFFTGTPLVAAVFGDAYAAAGWAGLLALVAYIGYYSDEFSIGFGLTTIALLLLLTQVLPGWATRPFAFVTEALLGIQLTQEADPVYFAVLTGAVVVLYWAFSVRLFGRGKQPSTVAERVRIKARKLVTEYVSITRVVFAFAFGATAIALRGAGDLAAEVTSLVADAPVVASNFIAGLGGYFALGGGLPQWLAWIPGLQPLTNSIQGAAPASYLFVAMLFLALAYGARDRLADLQSSLEKERRKRRESND